MKTVLAILLVIGTTAFASAQNYQLIKPNQEVHFAHFENFTTNIFLSIRIDSTHTAGANTIYFNHKVLSPIPVNPPNNCSFIETSSSWIGDRIDRQVNGDYFFFNQNNESILIKTLAPLNSNWTCYTFPNGDYIEATITSKDTTTILGILDSIKTLTLQVKDNSNASINHPFNGKEIKFSKTQGLIKFYPMLDFPNNSSSCDLVGHSNPNVGLINLNAAAIFNYNIGDEFHIANHFRNDWSPWMYDFTDIRRIVLDKVTSNNQDTISYTIEVCTNRYYNVSMNPAPDTTYSLDTIIERIVLSELTKFNQLSYEKLADSSTYATFIQESSTDLRAKRINNSIYLVGNNCWQDLIGNISPYLDYIEGMGGPYYNNSNFLLGLDKKELVYYNKNGLTWGNPINVKCSIGTSVSRIANDQELVSVYPNPFSDYLNIAIQNFTVNDNWSFELYDATGKLVRFKNVANNLLVIEKQNLSKGIYFYQLHNKTQSQSYTGKVVLQ